MRAYELLLAKLLLSATVVRSTAARLAATGLHRCAPKHPSQVQQYLMSMAKLTAVSTCISARRTISAKGAR
jgi:hypothetical protein